MVKTDGKGADLIIDSVAENITEPLLYYVCSFGKLVKFMTEPCEEGEQLKGKVYFCQFLP